MTRTLFETGRSVSSIALTILLIAGCNGNTVGHDATSSAVIGPDGGTLSVAGATVTVPPGSLSANQTITVRATSLPAPDGLQLYSPIFEFEPAGIQFAVPVQVRIDFNGDPTLAQFYWSRIVGPGYDVHTSTRSGMSLTATVTHFSTGFVGTPVVTNDGMVLVDANDGAVIDAALDAMGVGDATMDSPGIDAVASDATVDSSGIDAVPADTADGGGLDADSGDGAVTCAVVDAGVSDAGSDVTCTFTQSPGPSASDPSVCGCRSWPTTCTTQYNVPVTIDNGSGCCDNPVGCAGRALHIQSTTLSTWGYWGPDFRLEGAAPTESWTYAPGVSCAPVRSFGSGGITVTGGNNVSIDLTLGVYPGGPMYICAGSTGFWGCATLTVHCFGTATAL